MKQIQIEKEQLEENVSSLQNINKEIIRKRDEVNVEMKASFDRLNAFIAARMIDSI